MRIAFHVPRASHLKPGFSGDKILVRELIEGLRKRGHDVQVVSNLNVRNVWRGRISPRQLSQEMRRVREEMDCFSPEAWFVYGASTTNPDLFGWRFASRNTSQQPVYILYATDLGTGKRVPEPWRSLYVRAHQQSLARCDRLSVYHPSSHDELIRYGIPEQQVSLFPPAVRFWNQNLPQDAARTHLGLPPDSPILFCASRFPDVDEPDSGKVQMLFDLISASSSLPAEAVLLIAGDGPGKTGLEQVISSLAKPCAIRLVGAVDHDTMPLYFAACDFFVYPTSVDRPWLSVLEAQSCGRPVVTMRTRSSQLTVQDGKTGLLATDLNDFRQAISTLAKNRLLTREMGRSAAEFIAEHHSLERRIDQIESMLDGSPAEPVMDSSTSSTPVSEGN